MTAGFALLESQLVLFSTDTELLVVSIDFREVAYGNGPSMASSR